MKPRTKLSARLVAGLAATALLATGCGSSSDSKNDDSKSNGKAAANSGLISGMVRADEGTPVKGGTLVVGEYSEARSMDPTKTMSSGSVGGSVLASVYDTLVRFDWKTHTWEPQLAESLTSDDNKTWTLKLRKDVKFSDGTPLNADAVLGSLGYYLKNYGYNFATWSMNVADMKKTDDLTVTFTTKLPWATFPGMLAHGPGMILAPAAYKNAGADPAGFKPIGAGPFRFKEYKPTESLTVTASDTYFAGRPNLDAIKFTWPGADGAKNDALANGDIDAAFLREPVEVAKAKDAGQNGMIWVTGAGSTYMINNAEGRPGADVRVRQAVNLALDPEAYYKAVGNTAAVPNKNIMPKSSPWYQDVEIAKTDTAAAKKLIDEAKADGWDGKIKYSHLADPVSQKAAITLKAMLEAAGFQVTLEPQQNIADQTKKVFMDKDFDLAIGAYSIDEADPYTGLAAPLLKESPSNATGYGTPEMTAALTELAGTSGPEEGAAAMKKIQEIWQKDIPSVNLADGNFMFVEGKKLNGIVPSSQLLTLFDKAWLTK